MNLELPDTFVAILAILVGVLGVARLTRIAVYDDFPPAVWLRVQWTSITSKGTPYQRLWGKLLTCWWCLAPWLALICIAWWTWLIPLHPAFMYAWWVFWGMLAAGYVATMVIVRDTPPTHEDE